MNSQKSYLISFLQKTYQKKDDAAKDNPVNMLLLQNHTVINVVNQTEGNYLWVVSTQKNTKQKLQRKIQLENIKKQNIKKQDEKASFV